MEARDSWTEVFSRHQSAETERSCVRKDKLCSCVNVWLPNVLGNLVVEYLVEKNVWSWEDIEEQKKVWSGRQVPDSIYCPCGTRAEKKKLVFRRENMESSRQLDFRRSERRWLCSTAGHGQ